jgi:hypothetical protein
MDHLPKIDFSEQIINLKNNSAFIGFAAAFPVYSVTYPIEMLKIQMQLAKKNNLKPSVFDVIPKIHKYHGMTGFFRGYTPYIMAYSTFYGVYNWFYYEVKDSNGKDIEIVKNKFANKMILSNVASTIGSAITNPMYVIKTKIQQDLVTDTKINYGKTIQNVYKTEGIRGFFKGLNATLLNNLKLGIQFPLNDYLISEKYGIIFSSTVATIVSTTAFYPFDVIRTVQRGSSEKISIIDAVKFIYRKDGLRGFNRGNFLQILATGPNKIVTMILINYLMNKKTTN